jgi:uncharacterized membrane protein
MTAPARTTREWLRFAETALLVLGAAFVLAGIVFFFAYNWHGLHRFAKLGLASGLLAAAAAGSVTTWVRQRALSRTLLCATAVLIGVLLTLYGQVYQTGANAYDLFAGWALLSLPLALTGAFPALWLLWLAVANLALVFFGGQLLRDWVHPWMLLTLTLINAGAVAVSELAAARSRTALQHRWLPQIAGLAAMAMATIGLAAGIFDEFVDVRWYLFVPLVGAALAGTYYVYRHRVRDLAMNAIAGVSAITVVFCAFIKVTSFDHEAGLLLGGLLLLGLTTACVLFLLHVRRSWKREDELP